MDIAVWRGPVRSHPHHIRAGSCGAEDIWSTWSKTLGATTQTSAALQPEASPQDGRRSYLRGWTTGPGGGWCSKWPQRKGGSLLTTMADPSAPAWRHTLQMYGNTREIPEIPERFRIYPRDTGYTRVWWRHHNGNNKRGIIIVLIVIVLIVIIIIAIVIICFIIVIDQSSYNNSITLTFIVMVTL